MKKDKAILIKITENQFTTYKTLCKKHGLNMSQRLRNFIDQEIIILNKIYK